MTADTSSQITLPVEGEGMRPDLLLHKAGAAEAHHPLAFALILTGLAGFLDAAAYVRFNHLYVSFMSGNSTHLGMAIADWEVSDILAILGVVLAFVAGAALGTFIADHSTKGLIVRVLGLEAMLLLLAIAASLASLPLTCVMLVSLTMGLQNVLHQAVGGIDVGRGYVTGMLFSLGQSVARLVHGRADLDHARTSLLNWLVFVVGAAVGALAIHGLSFTFCLVMGGGLIGCLFIAAWATGRKAAT